MSANTQDDLEARLAVLADRGTRARLRRSERDYPALDEVRPVLDELVALYVSADETTRVRLRAVVAASMDVSSWLVWLAGEGQRAFETTGDAHPIELALAALSLEDKRVDERDTFLALGLVWHRMHRAGADPRAAFERAAVISSPGERGFAEFLRRFETSAFFREDVAPDFDRAELRYETE